MAEINRPRPSVEELTGKIREEMARHRLWDAALRDNDASSPAEDHKPRVAQHSDEVAAAAPLLPPLKLQPDFENETRDAYHVDELLKYQDAQFIQNAYRAILKRQPDREGYESHLENLRRGDVNKIDVLAGLRYSAEGRAKNVRIEGLRLPAAIRRLGRLPLLGYPIRLGVGLLRLPVLIRHQQQFETHALAQQQLIADYCNSLSSALGDISRKREEMARAHAELVRQHEATAARLAEVAVNLEASIEEVARGLEENIYEVARGLEENISEENKKLRQLFQEQLGRARSEIVLQGRRLERLIEEGRLHAPSGPHEDVRRPLHERVAPDVDGHFLDAFYAALEDRFRGSREEIKERFRVYLEHVMAAGDGRAMVVDLGCGRGEWLELLREEGIPARGVDTNTVLLDECRELGLNVADRDALEYLQSLPDQSFSAITGFHIIEHLPFDVLVGLVDESLRVLRPNGVVIFETPNPENVLVGSCYFYFDPTHRNPLPSLLMKFLMEARGLNQVEVLNLHPWTSARVEGDDELTARFNDLFYGPMDYAVVGRRNAS